MVEYASCEQAVGAPCRAANEDWEWNFQKASHSAMTAVDFLCIILVKGNWNDVAQFSIRKLVGPLEHLPPMRVRRSSLVETLGQEDT
jgi:hypothetical protein